MGRRTWSDPATGEKEGQLSTHWCAPKPACEPAGHQGREKETLAKWPPSTSGGCWGEVSVLPDAPTELGNTQLTPVGAQRAWGTLSTHPGLQPRATSSTRAHPSSLPQSPGHSPHLSRNVVGSLGRCVGYLGGYHHHLGSGRIHMGRGARPGRRVTLHTGRASGRLRPVLVEMLEERWGTSSGGVPAPQPGIGTLRVELPPPALVGGSLAAHITPKSPWAQGERSRSGRGGGRGDTGTPTAYPELFPTPALPCPHAPGATQPSSCLAQPPRSPTGASSSSSAQSRPGPQAARWQRVPACFTPMPGARTECWDL